MKYTPFDTYHPCVAALYLCAALGFSMAAFQPVYLMMNLGAAIAFNIYLRGWQACMRTLAWQIVLVIVVTLLNFLFSQSGSTILFTIGHRAYYLESLMYGIFMGIMLVAVMQWFSNFSHILTSDKILQLTGNTMPTLGLMITMILRLVPQFIRRNSAIRNTQLANTSAQTPALASPLTASPVTPQAQDKATTHAQTSSQGFLARKAGGIRTYLRDLSVLMGWSMEDSLETSEAMRARGWGASPKRSCYQRNNLRASDVVALVIMSLLIAINIFLAWIACSQFSFFPEIPQLTVWWGYAPYIVFLLMPTLFALKERILWKC